MVIGSLTWLMSMEPLGGNLALLCELTWPVMVAWLIWLTLIAISLLRTDEKTQTGMAIDWRTATVSTLIWSILMIPAYMG